MMNIINNNNNTTTNSNNSKPVGVMAIRKYLERCSHISQEKIKTSTIIGSKGIGIQVPAKASIKHLLFKHVGFRHEELNRLLHVSINFFLLRRR